MVNPHNGLLFKSTNDWAIDTLKNVDESKEKICAEERKKKQKSLNTL